MVDLTTLAAMEGGESAFSNKDLDDAIASVLDRCLDGEFVYDGLATGIATAGDIMSGPLATFSDVKLVRSYEGDEETIYDVIDVDESDFTTVMRETLDEKRAIGSAVHDTAQTVIRNHSDRFEQRYPAFYHSDLAQKAAFNAFLTLYEQGEVTVSEATTRELFGHETNHISKDAGTYPAAQT